MKMEQQSHFNRVLEPPQVISVNIIDEESEAMKENLELNSLTPVECVGQQGHLTANGATTTTKDFLLPQSAASIMAPNGNVGFKMKSQTMNGSVQNLKDNEKDDKLDNKSHMGSRVSLQSTLSALIHNNNDEEPPADVVLVTEVAEENHGNNNNASGTADQYIKDAIPYLPLPAAVAFLIMNVVFPGSGTIMCGLSIFLCGKSRFSSRDNNMGTTCCVNVSVGMSQMFTVTFMLVGWFWSLVWGIYMVILAVEYKNKGKLEKTKQMQLRAVRVMNANVPTPWALKT